MLHPQRTICASYNGLMSKCLCTYCSLYLFLSSHNRLPGILQESVPRILFQQSFWLPTHILYYFIFCCLVSFCFWRWGTASPGASVSQATKHGCGINSSSRHLMSTQCWPSTQLGARHRFALHHHMIPHGFVIVGATGKCEQDLTT